MKSNMLSVVIPHVVMPHIVMPHVVMLNVVAPIKLLWFKKDPEKFNSLNTRDNKLGHYESRM